MNVLLGLAEAFLQGVAIGCGLLLGVVVAVVVVAVVVTVSN
jgi:hypothetical protein